jgi:hypothetical protein
MQKTLGGVDIPASAYYLLMTQAQLKVINALFLCSCSCIFSLTLSSYLMSSGMLPLMEMVCYRLWKWYVTAYGNGMLPVRQWYVTCKTVVCYLVLLIT